MTVYFAALLLGYATVVGVVADRLLTRATWPVRFPALALRTWHACAVAFLSAVASASVVLAHDVWEHLVVWLFHAEERLVHLTYAGTRPVDEWWNAAIGPLLAIGTALTFATARRARTVHKVRSDHRVLTVVLARAGRHQGVYVLDSPAATVYCVPGRGDTARIVVTSGALATLTEGELTAAIEHERAHLRGRHHRMILWADSVTAVLGWGGILRNYAAQVRRLSEMAADDHAAGRCGARTVASALLAMCSLDPSPSHGGPAVLAMAGSRPAERIRRLLHDPPATTGRMSSMLTCCGAAILAAVPLVMVVIPAITLYGTAH